MFEVRRRQRGAGCRDAVPDRGARNLRGRFSVQGRGARRYAGARLCRRADPAARRDPRRLGSHQFVARPPGRGSSAPNPDPSRPLDLSPSGAAASSASGPVGETNPSRPYGSPFSGSRTGRSPAVTQSPLAPLDPGVAGLPNPPRNPAYGESVPISPSREAEAPTRSLAASVTPPATLACPVVSALDRWVTEAVQPAAQRWFGQPVVEIKQISAYSCRGMNGNPYARISEHAFGNALDIAGFVLADGHVITVRRGWVGTPEEQGFLHDVQSAACNFFSTVLAPGSNRFHYDHIHVDLMQRDSGRQICEPAAISGEAVAARARGRGGYARSRPADHAVTGSDPAATAGRPWSQSPSCRPI